MTEHTRISADGEAIIPKALCERLNWPPGTEIEIDEARESVLLRRKVPEPSREKITIEEFMRRVPAYEGPPVTLEQMNEGIEQARAERWAAKEARSR